MKEDARVHPRYELDAQAELGEAPEQEPERAPAGSHRIQNLSLGGICIQTRALEEIGAPVDVVLHLDQAGQCLDLRGQVVWVNRAPPEDVGIRWTALDDGRRAALTAYLGRVRRVTVPGL